MPLRSLSRGFVDSFSFAMKRCNTSQGFGAFFVQSCDRFLFPFSLFFLIFCLSFLIFFNSGDVFNKTIILLGLAGYRMIITNSALRASLVIYLTIILRNRAEYHLILSRRGRRPSWLNQGIFRKIEQDNCFIIQQFLIDYHFQNEKNYGSMMKR